MLKQAFKHLKSEAMLLRRQGQSYSEINKSLGIPKSTLSNWLKGIEFSEQVKHGLEQQSKLTASANIRTYNIRRHEDFVYQRMISIEQCADDIDTLSRRDIFFLFMGLFWGEGSKKKSDQIEIANSDPSLILVSIRFLLEHCNVARIRLTGSIYIHSNNNGDAAINFWSKLTGIAKERIHLYTVPERRVTGNRPINILPNGTFRLVVCNSRLNRQIMGWLRGTIKQAALPE